MHLFGASFTLVGDFCWGSGSQGQKLNDSSGERDSDEIHVNCKTYATLKGSYPVPKYLVASLRGILQLIKCKMLWREC